MAGERILIIEHESDLRDFAAQHLAERGFSVILAEAAESGIEAFAMERPELVLVDEALPWVGGIDVSLRLQARRPDIPIILIARSPLGSPMLDEARVSYGLKHLLMVPFGAAELDAAVSSALAPEAPLPAVLVAALAEVEPVLDAADFDSPETTGFQDPAFDLSSLDLSALDLDPIEGPEVDLPPRRPFGTGSPILTERFVSDVHGSSAEADVFASASELPGQDAEFDGPDMQGIDLPSGLRGEISTAEPEPFPDSAPPLELSPPRIEAVESGLKVSRRQDESSFALRPLRPTDPSEPQGIYGDVLLGNLLYNIFRDIFTGRLLLTHGSAVKTIAIRNGFPIFAESNVRSDDIGWSLMADGTLSEAMHAHYRALVDGQGVEPVQALSQMRVLDPMAFGEVQRRVVRERILNTFEWEGGQYGLSYDPGIGDKVAAVEINPLVLIFEGIKRTFPIAPLVSHFDGHGALPVRRTERLRDYARLLKDFPEEMRLADACDGEITVGGLIATSPFGLIDTLRTLRALEIMKCVDFERGEPAPVGRASMSMSPMRDRSTQPGMPIAPPGAPVPRPTRPSSPGMPVPRATGPTPARAASGSQPAATSGGHRFVGVEATGPMSSGSHAVVRPLASGSSTTEGTPVRRPDQGPSKHAQEEAARLRVQEKFAVLGTATHYELLEVAVESTSETIRNAYTRLSRLCSADQLNPAAEDDLKRRAIEVNRKLSIAWETLSDPRRRAEYDVVTISPTQDTSGKPDIVKAESNFQRGKICLTKGENKRALEFLDASVRQDAHSALYRIYHGWARYLCADANDLRTRTDAREAVKAALQADESQDAGYLFLGIMSKGMGNEEMAERMFRKALQLNASNADAQRELRLIDTRRRESGKEGGLFNRILGNKK